MIPGFRSGLHLPLKGSSEHKLPSVVPLARMFRQDEFTSVAHCAYMKNWTVFPPIRAKYQCESVDVRASFPPSREYEDHFQSIHLVCGDGPFCHRFSPNCFVTSSRPIRWRRMPWPL
jgi:hypothetical protein